MNVPSYPELRKCFQEAINLLPEEAAKIVEDSVKESERISDFQLNDDQQYVLAVGALVGKYEKGAEFTNINSAVALYAWGKEVDEVQAALTEIARADVKAKVIPYI